MASVLLSRSHSIHTLERSYIPSVPTMALSYWRGRDGAYFRDTSIGLNGHIEVAGMTGFSTRAASVWWHPSKLQGEAIQ